MKAKEAAGNSTSNLVGRRQSHRSNFAKVQVGRKQPIRGRCGCATDNFARN